MKVVDLSWIHYQKYPERRVTRLDPRLSDRTRGRRLVVFSRVKLASGEFFYAVDCALENGDPRFAFLVSMLFPDGVSREPGSYASVPVEVSKFSADEHLDELLSRFDKVSEMGWIDSLRAGSTGVGYTFETLIGIKENNDRIADFRGIEVKCKLAKEGNSASGKINLFQHGPKWTLAGPTRERLKVIGGLNEHGVLSCHSQVSTRPNNRKLWLDLAQDRETLFLKRTMEHVGQWQAESLAMRLMESIRVRSSLRRSGVVAVFRFNITTRTLFIVKSPILTDS